MLIHLVSAVGFTVLAAFLFVWRKERAPVGPLTAACLLNALWFLGQIGLTTNQIAAIEPMIVLEMLRAGAWLWFAASLLPPPSVWFEGRMFRLAAIGMPFVICILVIVGPAIAGLDGTDVQAIFVYGTLALVVIGLVILEQAYRNAPEESRWGIKMLIVGVGAIFTYDLFLFSHASLFGSIGIENWIMRGPANLLAIPVLIIGARRYKPMGLDVFVSRHVVFFSATLFGAGAYLIAMAVAGFYLSAIGGEWGAVMQAAFMVGAMIVLAIVLLSGSVRSQLKVFLAKHFYANRYDYREQWLALTQTLAADADGQTLARRAMRSIGAIAGSNAGALWMEDPRASNHGDLNFLPIDHWNIGQRPEAIATDAPFINWLRERMWVLHTEDCRQRPESFGQLALPEWLESFGRYQLILPLLAEGRLCGLMVLCEPKLGPQLDYEDIDLLKTVGSQVAAVLRQNQADELLAEGRQFEAYNRLTAFLMHDLKNLIAQQSLVVRNAARHKHDPEFIDDAIETIDNSVQRMERLLEQLRQGRLAGTPERVNLAKVAADAVSRHSDGHPAPQLGNTDDQYIRVDPEALASVVGHVIRNAQQACDPDVGCVTVSVACNDDQVEIKIKDNGLGMDEAFVRDRLFRPFDTTKGSQGMGIGAYQVREFVEQAGGQIRVESELGRGTVFRLCFPSLKLPATAAETKEVDQSNERSLSDEIA